MYLKEKSIGAITRYKLKNGYLVYLSGDGLFNLNLYVNGIKISDKKVVAFILRDHLYFSTIDERYFKCNFNSEIKELSIKPVFLEAETDYFFSRSDCDRTNIYKILSDGPLSSIENKMIGTLTLVKDNFIVNYYETALHVHILPSAKLLWIYDITALGTYKNANNENKAYEVRKFLGFWKDYLIASLTNDELLIINSKDGQLVQKVNKITPQKMAEYTVDYLGNCMILDQAEGKIKGFVNFVFWEFDLTNFTFECFNLADTLAMNNLNSLMNITSFAQSENHYFVTIFSIDNNGSMWSYLVAINKNSKNIDWKHEIPWTGNNAPQYSNDKLYQLDNSHTLHIFQKS